MGRESHMDYQKVLKKLSDTGRFLIEEGANVEFKRSSYLEKGMPDPFVLEKEAKGGAEFANGFQFPDVLGLDEYEGHVKIALALREVFGSENLDLTHDIETIEKMILGPEQPIRIRVYRNNKTAQPSVPGVAYFHGGGFFGGTIEVIENACKALAEKLPAVVINVDYRLAPEYAFPAAVEDCYAAVKWLVENAESLGVNPDQICVAGDSAGGNLATVVSWLDQVIGTNFIKFQSLLYPTVCFDKKKSKEISWSVDQYAPQAEFREKLFADLSGMESSHDIIESIYIKNADPAAPLISPIFIPNLGQMPPAYIAVAEFDYLRPFGEYYAGLLVKAGVQVKCICYEGMKHAFIDDYGVFPHAESCINEMVYAIKSALKLN
jgi:acetyl esterase